MTTIDTAPVERVLVIGYGAMGSGIALSFARAGIATTVLSRDPDRHGALPHGITAVAELPAQAPDLIIESVPEDMATKIATFRALEEAYGTGPDGPILATNTSGLPIEEIAAALTARERFLAAHYMQPADSLPMLEVARLPETRDDVLARTVDALERSGKQVIVLKKPITGFLINRLQHAILHEAYYLIESGVTTVEDVDRFARTLFGPRLCIAGLIEQKDLSGLDVHALAQRSIVPALHHGAAPSRLLQDKYDAGDLGAKTGRGFYDWSDRDVDAVRREAKRKLEDLIAYLDDM
jgi:3-hydroxybutyryl-CoA dehydrogenase